MPELPEVEAVCRMLRRQAEGKTIRAVKVMRCAPRKLERLAPGRKLERVERRGKHILLRLTGDLTLHVHLRISGNLYGIADPRMHTAYARVVMEIDGGGLVLEDPRALARMDVAANQEIDARLAKLGPEPLWDGFTVEWLTARLRQSRQVVKQFLMDQKQVAGLGNIYAAEVLHRSRIHPARAARSLGRERVYCLHSAIVGVMKDAVQSACIAYSGPGEFHEAETFTLAVYGREGEACTACGRTIRRLHQGGRSTYYCPGCQR
jgi:formamidopyrimidine-DNA glycosylase